MMDNGKIKETSERRTAKKRKVIAMTFTGKQEDHEPKKGGSKSLTEDSKWGGIDGVLHPDFTPEFLENVVSTSTALSSSIDVIATNVGRLGHRLVSRFPGGRAPSGRKDSQSKKERFEIENFLLSLPRRQDTAMLPSLRTFWGDFIARREQSGGVFMEVIRDKAGNWISSQILPTSQMRLTKMDEIATEAEVPRPEIQSSGEVTWRTQIIPCHFRKFVQAYWTGGGRSTTARRTKKRFFKSLWDPRVMDMETGESYEQGSSEARKVLTDGRDASEVIYYRLPGEGAYGTPRWISSLMAALGARSAEEVNFYTLESNNVPSMMITVSNGQLTEDTLKRITQFVEEHTKGNKNYSTFLVLEGEAQFEDPEAPSPVKIDVVPMTGAQVRESLFTNYMQMNQDRGYESFRLAPLFAGRTEQLNKATADVVRRLVDEQVFDPDRKEFDHFVNYTIMADRRFRYWTYSTLTPTITDNKELIAMMASAERTGGMSPSIARSVVEDVFPDARNAAQIDPEKLDPEVPMSLTMARAVQNRSDPTELNQQGPPTQPAITTPSDPVDAAVKASLKRYLESYLRGEETEDE